MGYYTNYTLTISPYNGKGSVPLQDREALEKELERMNVFEGIDVEYSSYTYDLKWYDHDTDMIKLSMKFPFMLFCLHGDGEDSEDFWDTYYRNGEVQHCPGRIEYDPFDESKLVRDRAAIEFAMKDDKYEYEE